MQNRYLLLLSFSLVFVLGILHHVASVFYFYWTLWWFDYLMHFLGGLSLGLFSIWVAHVSGIFGRSVPNLTRLFFTCFLPVLFIGVAWEVFEYAYGLTQATEDTYALDVAHDLIADMVGALLAMWVGSRRVFHRSLEGINSK